MSSIIQTNENFDDLPLFLEYLKTPSFNYQYEEDRLTMLMTKYNSDKGYGLSNIFRYYGALPPNKIPHNYTYFYDRLFSEYRYEPFTMFEMGIGVPESEGSWGASLIAWKEYFKGGKIYAGDINKDYLYNNDRIHSYYVDQESADSIKELWNTPDLESETFDLIIDDGSHTYTGNYLFYTESIHKLKTYGIYIIEDVNLEFIDNLFETICKYNDEIGIKYKIQKLIIPYPPNFTPSSSDILKINNLIFIQKMP